MPKYIHNKSTAHVSLINGKYLVKAGTKELISDADSTHDDVLHATRHGWITIEGEKSATPAPQPAPTITMAKDPMEGSTTIPVVEKKEPEVTSTPLGASEEKEEVKEVKSKKSKK